MQFRRSQFYLITIGLISFLNTILCKYFTLIDQTSRLLLPLGDNTDVQRIIYNCQNTSNCIGITRLKAIKYKDPTFYFDEDQIIISCENLENCYPFPEDDVRDVYTAVNTGYSTQFYYSWIDSSTNRFYCVSLGKSLYLVYLYQSFTIDNVSKMQLASSTTGVFVQVTSKENKQQILLITYTKDTVFSFDLPNDIITWNILQNTKIYVVLFFKQEIQVWYNNQMTNTYKLEGNGITDPDTQISFQSGQIIVKTFNPNYNQIRLIQINEVGNLIQDIRLPNIYSNNEINHIGGGMFDKIWYQQLNSTLLITVNQTYYASPLFAPNSVIVRNQGLTLLSYNVQYFEAFILEQTIVDQPQKSRILNSLPNYISFQNNSYLSGQQLQHNELLVNTKLYNNSNIDQHNFTFTEFDRNSKNQIYDIHQKEESQQRDVLNEQQSQSQQFELLSSSSLQDSSGSQITNGVQVVQQGIGLYYDSKNPCVIKDGLGNDIEVKQLEINIPSIFFSTPIQSDQIYNIYFSARVNGQWHVYLSSQRQLIDFSDSFSNMATMVVLCLSTYFLVRGGIHFLSGFQHRKEAISIKDFIVKQTQTKITEKLFHKCYTIQMEKKLGEGAFGVVYECQYTPSNEFSFIKNYKQNQLFACKILTNTNDNLPSILSEIDALQSVKDCKSAIKMINYCITSDKVYIVLEKAEQSLEDYIQKRYEQPFSSDEIIDIALDLIEVLVQLRNKNFNHRDIKPSNILIMPDKQIKLTDFGAAKRINLSNFTKKSDELIGSLPWMAPELLQAVEEDDEINLNESLKKIDYEKCDIFSLGLTLLYVVLRVKLKGCNRFEHFLNNFFATLNNEYSYIQQDFRIMLKKMTSFDSKKRPSCFIIKQHLLEMQRQSFLKQYSQNDNETINK